MPFQARVYDPDPDINARIARAVRYGQTRWAEIWLSVVAVLFGAALVSPEQTFDIPPYEVIKHFVSEDFAGGLCLFFGTVRIVALIINGRRGRETSLVRTVGCMGGFAFWSAMTLGFALAMPPISLGFIASLVFSISELHSSSHAASDMAAEDTFGFRKRRRKLGDAARSPSVT